MSKATGADILDYMLQPYAEDDALLNDWVNEILHHVKWDLFENQEEWLYKVNEVEESYFPRFKENAYEYIYDTIKRNFGWLACYMRDRLIAEYRLSNIDLDEETIWNLKEDMGEETYNEWENEARARIFKDYAKYLGEEKARKLFEEVW